ncbi:hypothetical protein CQW23_24385 [Capsicum baccatum]|uniref:23 kDa subunit of oxygen evolving system of photosystem II n=1 Tax=Capsicum baccatum TaxID=33114 RepID=A0A2G2VUN5_CAPBA|nr:hypothetical protein CQW23_24385 [Capsicum baccatum]
MACSTQCFLHDHLLSKTPLVTLKGVSDLKPNKLVYRAQRDQQDNGNNVFVSRRLALTILFGAAAIGSKVSPADAAYGESGVQDFAYISRIYADCLLMSENAMDMVLIPYKKSITDYGSPEQFLSQVDFLLGKQVYFGKTDAEGGFESDAVATANILETSSATVGGKQYYYLSVLTRTADGDEGGKHQLITATVNDGKLYICKAQAGDKRWFKGARKFVENAASSFNLA